MRSRGMYLLAVMATIMLGIGSRMYTSVLPDIVATHSGDALWAAMIYFGVRSILIRMSLLKALLLTIGFCYAIECSQLVHTAWADSIRSTLLGGLILGHGFLYLDLVRYSVGAAAAYILDHITARGRRNIMWT